MTNDTQPVTLTDFLLARIADDEKWLAMTNPRLKRECNAKRGIVMEMCRAKMTEKDERSWWKRLRQPAPIDTRPKRVLCLMALPYREHPDWHQDWDVVPTLMIHGGNWKL